MEFDSGGNDVRIRTGKTLGLGKAPLIGVRRDSNVSSDKNQKPNKIQNQINFAPLVLHFLLYSKVFYADPLASWTNSFLRIPYRRQ